MADAESIASVSVSKDKLSATLYLPPGHAGAVTLEHLVEAMRQRQVVIDPQRLAAAEALLKNYEANPDTAAEGVVAQGQAPVDGRDARLEIDESLISRPEQAQTAETPDGDAEGGVDHYAQSAFTIVRAGQTIGRFVPEEPPTPGFDVMGQPLSAKGGAPLDFSGSEFIRITDGGDIVACKSGALVLAAPDDVRITDSLTIDAYVDFSTGNIDFPGDVFIAKSVRDRFSVCADRSIQIGEHVESAEVIAGLDITIAKGMSGRERGRLRAGRDLRSKYINASNVVVGRDAEIEKEMVDTTATIGRSLQSPRCTLVGGSVTLGSGGEVAQVGSEGGAPTDVILGRYPQLDRIAAALTELLLDAQKRSARKTTALKQLQSATKKLSPDQAEQMTELQCEAAMLGEKLRTAGASLESAWNLIKESGAPSLTVHRTIHAGSRIFLGGHKAEFKQDVSGPVRIDLDAKGVPRITDLGPETSLPLAKVARVLTDDRFLDWAHWVKTAGEIAQAA